MKREAGTNRRRVKTTGVTKKNWFALPLPSTVAGKKAFTFGKKLILSYRRKYEKTSAPVPAGFLDF